MVECAVDNCRGRALKDSLLCKRHFNSYKCVVKGCDLPVARGSLNFCQDHLEPPLVLRRNEKGKIFCISKDNTCMALSRNHKDKLCISCGREKGLVFNTTAKMLTTVDQNGNLI
jgi:hypothetical protein